MAERRPASGLRIAVANTGDPADPRSYSGTPASLLGGLAGIGADAVPIAGALPDALGGWVVRAGVAARLKPRDRRDLKGALVREHPGAMLGRLVGAAQDVRLAAALRAAGPLDGVVHHGTEYRLPRGTRYVTYEDATTRLARRSHPWPHLAGLSEADLARHDARAAAAYARARTCCAMSHWAARSLVDDFGLPPERVAVVGVGAVRRLTPPPTRDWSVPRLLFVGFDWERKNGPRVLRAFAKLREEHPEATLDVVGGHPPLDVAGVTGHGTIGLEDPDGEAKLARLFDRATCFVMPSLHEPAGQAYIEAGAAGIASVGTTAGGAPTVVGDGGRCVDPEDDEAIVDAIRELSVGDSGRAAGERAQAHAALLSWEQVAERLVRALAPPGVDVERLAPFL